MGGDATWFGTYNLCTGIGGDLISIHSKTHNDAILTLLGGGCVTLNN